ncbi:MAG: ribonuclease P [Methanoregulaceae archaeon]|nr:ribonuclease P [Methanoregulaceae archaeon]
MARRSQSPVTKRIARERIAVLFSQAARFFPECPEWSNRCVDLARKIAMRQRIRIEKEYRRRFCRHCSTYLVPGVTMRVRVQRGRVIVTCLACRRQMRYVIGRQDAKGAE